LVSSTARRYEITRSLLVMWRRQFGVRAAVGGSGLVPAVVVPERAPAPSPSSRMEIVAANGRRIIVDVGVDAAALSRVLDVLERR
jgi:transposase